MKSYRKIWIDAYGPITKDSNGRSYEIHHINGDHSDNRLENLTLVTIEEHYQIHFNQGDWGACQAIAKRMKLSSEENSKLCSILNQKRVEDGTHNFIGNSFLKGKKGKDHPRFGISPWNKGNSEAMSGNKNPFFGKKHSEETLQKMRRPKTEEHKDSLRKPKSYVPRFKCILDEKEMSGCNMARHFKRNYNGLDWKEHSVKIR